jgi:hypothetical protein
MFALIGGVSLFIVTNVRSYLGLAALLMIVIGASGIKGKARWCLCLFFFAFTIVSALTYPMVRALRGGDWFMPGNDMAYLLAAGWSSEGGGTKLAQAVELLPVHIQPYCKKLAERDCNFDYIDAKHLVMGLLASDYTTERASLTLRSLAQALNKDTNRISEIRLRKALISCGFFVLGNAGKDVPTMKKGWPSSKLATHHKNVFKYHAWFWGANQFHDFFDSPRDIFVATSEGQNWFVRTHSQYIKKQISKDFVDPMRLTIMPLDLWAAIGLFSIVFLLFPPFDVRGAILSMPIIINFIVMALVPLGNPRYSYSLIPIYFIAAICAFRKKHHLHNEHIK